MKFTHTIDINAPRVLVWNYLEDVEKQKQWMKGVVDNVPTSEGPTQVGSTFRMSIREGRKVSDYDGEILVYEPHRSMAVRLMGGCFGEGMSMRADYELTELPAGQTRLDYVCTGHLTGVWRYLSPVMRLMCGMQIRGFFKTLRSLAESEAGSGVVTA